MYEARQNKEKVSRRIDAVNSGARQRVKVDSGRILKKDPSAYRLLTQKMSLNQGRQVVDNVKSNVPYAANRFFDIIRSSGESMTNRELKDAILNNLNNLIMILPFGSGDINIISHRAAICNITKGAVCDDYQEMGIAEIDRRNWGGGETVYREFYPGHSYISVKNARQPKNRDSDLDSDLSIDPWDLIIDPWRNMVDYRRNFNIFNKYKTASTKYVIVNNMKGQTNWLDANQIPVVQNIRSFLNDEHIQDTGNLLHDLNEYKRRHPGYTPFNQRYLM